MIQNRNVVALVGLMLITNGLYAPPKDVTDAHSSLQTKINDANNFIRTYGGLTDVTELIRGVPLAAPFLIGVSVNNIKNATTTLQQKIDRAVLAVLPVVISAAQKTIQNYQTDKNIIPALSGQINVLQNAINAVQTAADKRSALDALYKANGDFIAWFQNAVPPALTTLITTAQKTVDDNQTGLVAQINKLQSAIDTAKAAQQKPTADKRSTLETLYKANSDFTTWLQQHARKGRTGEGRMGIDAPNVPLMPPGGQLPPGGGSIAPEGTADINMGMKATPPGTPPAPTAGFEPWQTPPPQK